MLIQANTLNEILSDSSLIIFDTRFSLPGPDFDPTLGEKLYQQSHIPNAIYVDLEKDLSRIPTEKCGRHPLPEAENFLGQLQAWGLEPGKQVVIYDDKNNLLAARLWWMLRHWIGHESVSLLDGGFPAWQSAGFQVYDKTFTPQPSQHRYKTNEGSILGTSKIVEALIQKNATIVDARAHARFLGQNENVDPVAGHIPSAVNYPCMENFNESGKFHSTEQLKQRFTPLIENAGGAEKVVHMCGSGVTACHNIFAMELAGLHGSKLYPGSWSEWIRNKYNPVAVGE